MLQKLTFIISSEIGFHSLLNADINDSNQSTTAKNVPASKAFRELNQWSKADSRKIKRTPF